MAEIPKGAEDAPHEVTDGPADVEEEWTQVKRKSRRAARPVKKISGQPAPIPKPAATASLSVDDIEKEHNRILEQWADSDCLKKLEDIIKNSVEPPRITKAVCFGIGTFDPEDGGWEVKRRTHIQLAAFSSVVKLLADKQDAPIPCSFQEPVFSPGDKEFVQRLGHEVVETPAGFDLVDTETLVFGIHLYRDIYSQAIAKATPAVFIGTGYDVWDK